MKFNLCLHVCLLVVASSRAIHLRMNVNDTKIPIVVKSLNRVAGLHNMTYRLLERSCFNLNMVYMFVSFSSQLVWQFVSFLFSNCRRLRQLSCFGGSSAGRNLFVHTETLATLRQHQCCDINHLTSKQTRGTILHKACRYWPRWPSWLQLGLLCCLHILPSMRDQ